MMECKAIQEKLSAYLEGVISPEEKRLIEHHLTLCGLCRSSLGDLQKTGDLVKNLEGVEPPAWLKKKIMARVRAEEDRKRGIIQKLFYPLPIKIPVGALATVFLAVIAVYVFKAVEPEIKSIQMPPGERAVARAPLESKEKGISERGEDEKGGAPKLEERHIAKEAEERRPLPAEKRKEVASEQEVRIGTADLSQEARLQEQYDRALALKKEKSQVAARAAAPETRERKTLAAVPPVKGLADKRTETIGFTLHVRDVQISSQEVQTLLGQVGAQRIETESLEGRVILAAMVKPEKIEELREKLHLMGKIQEKSAPSAILEGNARIMIEIVTNPQ